MIRLGSNRGVVEVPKPVAVLSAWGIVKQFVVVSKRVPEPQRPSKTYFFA